MNNIPQQITLRVTDALELLNIRYVIVGSFASSVHGRSRITYDSDLVADIQLQHVPLVAQQLKDEFYLSIDAMFDAVQHRSSFNLIHLEFTFKVDIFVAKARPFEQSQLENRQSHLFSSDPKDTVYIASAEDTILAKLEWYRLGDESSSRQLEDIRGVIQMQGSRLDIDYLYRMAVGLNVQDLLEKVLPRNP